jgi:hypothetical protein
MGVLPYSDSTEVAVTGELQVTERSVIFDVRFVLRCNIQGA